MGDFDLPGLECERDELALWCEMVRARVGEAEVVSSSVNPPVLPRMLPLLRRTPPLAETDELDDELDPPLPVVVVVMRRFEAIFRSPGASGFAGEGGNALVPTIGLLRWGVDFILAGDLGGLNGPVSVPGTFLVVSPVDEPALGAGLEDRAWFCICRSWSCCCCSWRMRVCCSARCSRDASAGQSVASPL